MLTQPRIGAGAAGLLVVVALGAAPGCTSTTERGTPYTIKMDRELQAYVNADLPTTHAAAKSVLEDEFLFLIEKDALDGREGLIEARSAKERHVRVESYRSDDATTKVQIFVTPFGYERMELDILGRLEDALARGST